MAQDYINPTAIRPEYGWKPEGFLAGMNYASDRQRYEDVSSLQDYMMKNDASMSGMKLADYSADAPVREAERRSKTATFDANTATIGGIKQNEMQKGSLDNDLASGVLKSKIAEAAANAAIKGGEASAKEFERSAAMAGALSKAAGSGPEALARVIQHLKTSGANPQILDFFSQAKDVKQLKQMADAMNEGLLEADSKYQQHMRGIEVQRKSQEKIAGIQAQAQKDIAEIRQKTKLKNIDQMLQDVLKLTPDKQIGFYDQVLADSDATLEQKQKALVAKDAAIKALNLRAPKDDPIIPGLPASTPRRYGEGPGSGSTNTGIPGVTRLP